MTAQYRVSELMQNEDHVFRAGSIWMRRVVMRSM
jgi:hypothetical protein